MEVTLDVGSGFWVHDGFMFIVDGVLGCGVELTLGFPTLNEVEVERLQIQSSGEEVHHGVVRLPREMGGRSVQLKKGGWVNIPRVGVNLKVLETEMILGRMTFQIGIPASCVIRS